MEKQNVHVGHRKRLRILVDKVGVDSLSEVQVLEYTLTFVFPRCDTNPIAHSLLETFGTFSKVLDAPWWEVAKVKGMGEETAKMLTTFPQIFFEYQRNKLGKKQKLLNRGDAQKFCMALLESRPKEEFYAICLNANSEVKAICKIAKGRTDEVSVNTRDIADVITRESPTGMVITHCHPDLSASPSTADIASTREIKKLLDMLGVQLIDHIIIGVESIFSFWENGMI